MKNFLYVTLIAIGIAIIFYIFFDTKPNALILTVLGLSIVYLLVQFIREIFSKSEKNKNEK